LIGIENTKNTTIYLFDNNRQLTKIQYTTSPNFQTKKGIGIHSELANIQMAYPNTVKRLTSHTKGFYLILPAKGLLFNLNLDRRIVGWGLFVN